MPLALEREIDDQRIEDVETLEIGEIHVDHVTRFWEYEDPDTLIRRHYVVGDFVQHNNKRYRCLVEHDATTTFSVRWGDPKVAYWIRVQKMAPQRDRRAAGYFSSGRGRRSVRYGVLRLKRIVLLRARYTELSFALPYKTARNMSCADAIRIEVPRVGEVVGKIVSIERTIQRGEVLAHIRIASTNGDGSIAPAPIEDQEQTAELAYSISFGRLREPVDATALATSGPFAWTVENDADTQAGLVRLAEGSGLDPMSAINKNPTRLIIAYPPLIEEDTLTHRISVTTEALRVPKQISFLPGE